MLRSPRELPPLQSVFRPMPPDLDASVWSARLRPALPTRRRRQPLGVDYWKVGGFALVLLSAVSVTAGLVVVALMLVR